MKYKIKFQDKRGKLVRVDGTFTVLPKFIRTATKKYKLKGAKIEYYIYKEVKG